MVRLLKARRSADQGFSLIELIVAMGIFTIFIAIFLTAVVSLARGTTQARVTAESSGGALIVFQNIDRQVRYADAINFPGEGISSGARYIEFRTPASSMATNVTTCTQWRYLPSKNRIESRRWDDTAGSTATPWATKLTTVIDKPGVGYPFTLVPATASVTKQQLLLTLDAGTAGTSGATSIATTFVARNSSKDSVSNVAGPDGQSVTKVCDRMDFRP
jgi:prepilin-type N-terminal cleavage/methylation domain-containing protein